MNGPRLRTDLITALVVRAAPGAPMLQLRRTRTPMQGSWQPVMGKVEQGERAIAAAVRELREETALLPHQILRFWQLEQTPAFLLSERDEVFITPSFLAEVCADWEPTLNDEHDASRWVLLAEGEEHFLWPSQWSMLSEVRAILRDGSPLSAALRREVPSA